MGERNRKKVKMIVFGPVHSRRLGRSLGINIIPAKTCSLDCVYCQIGKTRQTGIKRRPYVSPREVMKELKKFLDRGVSVDYITLSGAGEPTLNSQLGNIIRKIKEETKTPVAVITNATLLNQAKVRRELLAADLVLPSLDAVRQKTFEKVNRPHRKIKVNKIIEGLKVFRRQFKGAIWLEIMLVKNTNESREDLAALKDVISSLKPDRLQLNTVVRKPAYRNARPLREAELQKIQKFFGRPCEIITGKKDRRAAILQKLRRG